MRTLTALFLTVFLFSAIAACAQNADVPAYHIEILPAKHIDAVLTDTWETPKIIPRQWAMFAPAPPKFPGQDLVMARMSLDVPQAVQGQTEELSPLHRPILWIRAQAPKDTQQNKVTTRVEYEAILYSRQLVSGPPNTPVMPLSSSERDQNLRSSDTIDFKASAFQKWLNSNYLHRQAAERDLDFAFRAYQTIRHLYHYHYDPKQDRKASQICLTNQSDCGGLSYLLVASLRANGIPSHGLAGRMAKSSVQDNGQTHVRSEFYSEGIGWVPVDMSYGVSCQDKDASNYFGNDPGDLLTMHSDTDLVLNPKPFGPTTFYIMQGMYHWVWGSGKFDGSKDTQDWQVMEIPLVTPQETAR